MCPGGGVDTWHSIGTNHYSHLNRPGHGKHELIHLPSRNHSGRELEHAGEIVNLVADIFLHIACIFSDNCVLLCGNACWQARPLCTAKCDLHAPTFITNPINHSVETLRPADRQHLYCGVAVHCLHCLLVASILTLLTKFMFHTKGQKTLSNFKIFGKELVFKFLLFPLKLLLIVQT